MPSTTRLALTLTGAALLGAVGAAMHMASSETQDRIAAFAREGRVADGKLDEAAIIRVSRSRNYELTAKFVAEDGSARTCFSKVPNTLFEQALVRGTVQVTYLASRPRVCFFDGDRPRAENAAIFDGLKWGGWLTSVAAIISLFFGGSGGGQPAPSQPRTPPRGPQTVRPATAQFGGRSAGGESRRTTAPR